MNQKRWSRADGVEFETDDRTAEALRKMERAKTQRARLLRVAEIPKLRHEAERLLRLFPEFRIYTAEPGFEYEHATIEWQITELEKRAIRWELAEQTWRDNNRQAGTRKKRRSRWPDLDAYIRAELCADPGATALELFDRMPGSFDGEDFYVDGDRIIGSNDRELQFGGFEKRVSKIRKEIRNAR